MGREGADQGAPLSADWVSVHDALPDDKQPVTVTGKPTGCVGYAEIDIVYFTSVGFISNITHWKSRETRPERLADIRDHYKARVIELAECGLTPAGVDDDLEMIGELLGHIAALESEIKESDSYHNGEHLKDAHRINALEADKQYSQSLKVKLYLREQTITALETERVELSEYVKHKTECVSGKRRWDTGKYTYLECTCGLDELLKQEKDDGA